MSFRASEAVRGGILIAVLCLGGCVITRGEEGNPSTSNTPVGEATHSVSTALTQGVSSADQAIGEDASPPGPRAAVDGYFPTPTYWLLPPGNYSASSDAGVDAGYVAPVNWLYTFTPTPAPTNPAVPHPPPASDWTAPSFVPSGWMSGHAGFGNVPGPDEPQDVVHTAWPAGDDIWLRATFVVGDANDIDNLMLWSRWDNNIDIYINGIADMDATADFPGWYPQTELNVSLGYRYLGITPAIRATIVSGQTNTIAVHVAPVSQGAAEYYFDLGITTNSAMQSRPSAGFEQTSALAQFTQTVQSYMLLHGLTAGTLAVMKENEVVVKRSLGWSDKYLSEPLGADTVVRLASNDKVLTRGAVEAMIASQVLDPVTKQLVTWSTPVFPLLRAHGLTAAPGKTPDPNIDLITIQNLYCMNAGLQELPGQAQFYTDLSIPAGSPTNAQDDVEWVYSTPLAYTPGSPPDGQTFVYSSSSYMVLRYLVSMVEGDFLTYLRNVVLAPVGTSDVDYAHEVLANRDPREPWYATLEAPYDRWIYLENYLSLASTPEAFVRYLRGYAMCSGSPLISASGVWSPPTSTWCNSSCGQTFDGEYDGAWTSTEQDPDDQVSFAVFFNEDTRAWPLRVALENVSGSLSAAAWGLPLQINAGGPATSPFTADEDSSGGSTIDHANTINLSGVMNPAPMAVYQSARTGNFIYTLPGFTASSSHTVRLHFAETYFSTAGSRVFNVSINGTQVLSKFDIYKAAGAENKAIVEQFTANANSSGGYVIQFSSVVNNSLVSAIEVQ
jgi:CubicO group peptidase (beta-lactamase class C family)